MEDPSPILLPESYRLEIRSEGLVPLPPELSESLGLEPGTLLSLTRNDISIRLDLYTELLEDLRLSVKPPNRWRCLEQFLSRTLTAVGADGGVALGKELMALHLLEDPRLSASPVQLDGDRRRFPWIDAKALLYHESTGTVRLTRSGLGFAGVAPEVWRHQVGSYPVLERWLRARAGHLLTVQAIRELRWIAEAVRLSLAVQRRLQEVI